MKVARNESTITDIISTCLSDVSNTANMERSLPDHLSGNHPEPAVHPRMNFRFEQRALHCDRTPLTFHTSCHASICYDCLYLLCLSPLYLLVDPEVAIDYTAAGYDYVVDDRTPTVELPGKQSHSLPQISPTFPYFSCTRHNFYCYDAYLFNCIACFCRPLMYLPLAYAACYIYTFQQ